MLPTLVVLLKGRQSFGWLVGTEISQHLSNAMKFSTKIHILLMMTCHNFDDF